MTLEIDDVHIEELRVIHKRIHRRARERLHEFRAVPRARYFYELCYCLLTPQTSAAQCFAVASELERRKFLDIPFDAAALLRSFEGGYVRFHNTKARRLAEARENFPEVLRVLDTHPRAKDARDALVSTIRGLGMKESSHFLRNIGRTDCTIVDRHILRNLVRIGALDEWPRSISRARYLRIEEIFEALAALCDIPADELDLVLWSRETGAILK